MLGSGQVVDFYNFFWLDQVGLGLVLVEKLGLVRSEFATSTTESNAASVANPWHLLQSHWLVSPTNHARWLFMPNVGNNHYVLLAADIRKSLFHFFSWRTISTPLFIAPLPLEWPEWIFTYYLDYIHFQMTHHILLPLYSLLELSENKVLFSLSEQTEPLSILQTFFICREK